MAGTTTTPAPGITELNPGSGIYGNQQGQETDAQGNVLSQAQINAADTVYRANGGGALSTSNPNLNPYGDTSAQQSAMNDTAANFWSAGGSTTPMSFAGGSLTNNGDGTATFTPTGGSAEQLNQNMSFAQMAVSIPLFLIAFAARGEARKDMSRPAVSFSFVPATIAVANVCTS
jgi:hypothetical protein